MSKFIRHERCPVCNSDDNLAIYEDGWYCHTPGCTNRKGENHGVAQRKPTTFRMPEITAVSMTQRGIPERVVSKFGCGVEYDSQGRPRRFHFPNYENGILVGTKYRIVNEGGVTWEDKQFRWLGESAGLFGMQAAKDRGSVIIHEGECYPGNTEVLTPAGWIALEDYDGQEVAQYEAEYNQLRFVAPSGVVSHQHRGEIVSFSNHRKYSVAVTPEHDMVYRTPEGEVYKRRASQGLPASVHHIIRSATAEGEGVPYTDDELRLIVAVSADAGVEYLNKGEISLDFNLKKQRKIDRLRMLVDKLNINASFCVHTNRPDYTRVRFNLPKRMAVGRLFPHFWIGVLSARQKEIIIRELKEWDGWEDEAGRHCEYTTKYKENADFIQTIASTTSYTATLCEFYGGETNYKRNKYYKVNIHYDATPTTVGSIAERREQYDGYVYCLTVPSGMLLVRHNNCISVCGNCDAMAGSVMMGVSFSNVSITHGAKGAVDDVKECWQWLDKYETIYLSFDSDEPGRTAAADVAALFKPGKCKVVVHATGFKDANDYLVRGAVDEYKNAVYAAQVPRPQGLIGKDELKQSVRDFLFNPEKWKGIPTGIKGFDRICGGLRPGAVIAVYGGTGLGKTAFVRQIAFNTLCSGNRVLFIPLEMRVQEVGTQLIEMYLKRRILEYEAGKLNLTEDEFEHATNIMFERLFMIRHYGAMTLQTLAMNVEHAARVENVKLVVLDHKDAAINSGIEDDSNSRAIDALMAKVKELALSLDITVIIVSHISRSMHDRDDVIPDLNRIRGSQGVAQNSDVVFGVTRPRNSNVLEVLTKKGDRFTSGNGSFKLKYNTDTLCYEEVGFGTEEGEDEETETWDGEEETSRALCEEISYNEESLRISNTGIESIISLRTSHIQDIDRDEVHTGLEVCKQDGEDNICGEQGLSETTGQNEAKDVSEATPRYRLAPVIYECWKAYQQRQSTLNDLW